MRKCTILGFHRAQEAFLARLQDLGMMHITLQEHPRPEQGLQALEAEIRRGELFLTAAQKFLRPRSGQSGILPDIPCPPRDIITAYEQNEQEREVLLAQIEKDERQQRNIAPWGSFDRKRVQELVAHGVRVRFFIAPFKKYEELTAQPFYGHEISRDKTYVYFVVFEHGSPVTLDVDEFEYPDRNAESLAADLKAARAQLSAREDARQGLFAKHDQVRAYLQERRSEYAFRRISSGLARVVDDNVFVVSGWIPQPQLAAAEAFLRAEGVYYETAAAQLGDDVPVLLQNNRFVRLFEPITRLFSLPQYQELDLTAFFAPFFILFFGFCLSDAGYGLVILLACWVSLPRVSSVRRPLLKLGMLFGATTFVVGLISGTLFGLSTAGLALPGLAWLKTINIFTQDQLFYVALLLGIVQVFFGMALKVINRSRQYGAMAGVSTIGWMLFLAGVLRLLLPSIVPVEPAAWALPLTGAGFALILLFNDLKANLFVRIGKGLWEIYGITGIFGDILSYVRLFALGVSSTILGIVINEISWSLRTVPVIGYGLTFVGLLVGHTGNLLLSALSSFVHPLRLTFVEFYKSVGFAGGGKAYQPFTRAPERHG